MMKKMKTLTLTSLVGMALAASGFGRIGDDEKQIEAQYGKAGKDLGNHGEVHEVGYMSGGFMILVDFVNGISQREGFANPDTSPLTAETIRQILAMSAAEGTKWQEASDKDGDKMWSRSDKKAVAILPAQGKFFFVQDANFVQPK
jgi:hypothetical protein